jgi:hypothetical protein
MILATVFWLGEDLARSQQGHIKDPIAILRATVRSLHPRNPSRQQRTSL